MKKSHIVVIVATLLSVSAPVMADSQHGWQNRHDNRVERREDRRDDRHDSRQERREDRREHRDERHHDRNHHGVKKVSYVNFRRGDAIPYTYRNSRYFVSNWRQNNLYEPPRGYRWIKVNGRHFLVSNDRYVVYNVR